MFGEESAREKTPWYRRPPVLAALAVLLAAAAAAYLFLGRGVRPNTSAHFEALERQREEQRRQAEAEAAGGAAAPAEEAPAAEGQAAAGQEAAPAAVANPSAPAVAQVAGARRYWTNFRGPARDGRYEERQVKEWPAGGPPLAWKQLVGGGYSSFVVADGVAYTIEQRRSQEVVAAYRVSNGRELWTAGWDTAFTPGDMTGDGPRSTPTWDDGRLYALGAAGEFRCLDAKTGRVLWAKNILSDNGAQNLQWGQAASPLIVDDKVIVMPGGTSGKSVVAYDKLTGARRWGAMNDQASYTSPMLVNLAGRRQVLVVTARRAAGLAPEDGAVLWEHSWPTSMGINVAQPLVVGANRFVLTAGYGHGAALVEVSGAGGAMSARALWESKEIKTKFNSAVYHEGHVYGLDEGILACVDAATGERRWKGGRYGYGQVLLASGHLIVTTEEGEVVIVRASPEAHAEVARFKAVEGKTWNVPAIADGRLLVRNATEMACFKLTD